MREAFIGVHVGAGCHSEQKTTSYKLLCQEACVEANKLLKEGQSAVTAVARAVEILENSPHTNAGYGSNLTESGLVECDASIMDGDTLQFGAVGAVSDVKNPVHFAKKLLDEQCKGLRSFNRIPPCFLVGASASEWARKNDIQMCSQKELTSDGALNSYRHYKRKLLNSRTLASNKRIALDAAVINVRAVASLKNHDEPEEEVSDTVGAVAVDRNGNVAAACSSGGLVLKQPGRVGQAGVYGCGCWAQNHTADRPTSIATSTSGCGEYLIKTLFARECAAGLMSSESDCLALTLEEQVRKNFMESQFLNAVEKKLVGVVVLKLDNDSSFGEFLWSHTTNSMCVGYMSTADAKPVSRMSRLSATDQAGSKIIVEGTSVKLLRKPKS